MTSTQKCNYDKKMEINMYEELRENILQSYDKGLVRGKALHIILEKGFVEWCKWIKICTECVSVSDTLNNNIKNNDLQFDLSNDLTKNITVFIANMILNLKKGVQLHVK